MKIFFNTYISKSKICKSVFLLYIYISSIICAVSETSIFSSLGTRGAVIWLDMCFVNSFNLPFVQGSPRPKGLRRIKNMVAISVQQELHLANCFKLKHSLDVVARCSSCHGNQPSYPEACCKKFISRWLSIRKCEIGLNGISVPRYFPGSFSCSWVSWWT